MLDVKKLMTKIINAFAVKETTPTKYGTKWTSGNIQVYKRSGIVTVKCNGVAISALSARTQIATVPDGYRPVSEHGAPFDGSSVFWFVSADGSLKVNATGANTFWGAMTYVGGGTP